jgi:hypothetical protein
MKKLLIFFIIIFTGCSPYYVNINTHDPQNVVIKGNIKFNAEISNDVVKVNCLTGKKKWGITDMAKDVVKVGSVAVPGGVVANKLLEGNKDE